MGKGSEAFNLSYKGKSGSFTSKSQNNLRATVLGFLKFHIGEIESYDFTLGTQEQLVEEVRQREAETPPTRDNLKSLYNQCRTNRDRALLLSLIHGFGLSEWLDFARIVAEIRLQGTIRDSLIVRRESFGTRRNNGKLRLAI